MRIESKLPPQETRRRVLEVLKRKGPQTAQTLSRTLGITSMGVRQQLNALERDGLIQYRIERKGLGRPGHVYLLTGAGDELFPGAILSSPAACSKRSNCWMGKKESTGSLPSGPI